MFGQHGDAPLPLHVVSSAEQTGAGADPPLVHTPPEQTPVQHSRDSVQAVVTGAQEQTV